MSDEIEQTELMCAVCNQDTVQQVNYAGRLLTHVTCTECGTVVRFDTGRLTEDYVADLHMRIRTKPRRLLRRARKHPLDFISTLPGAIARQPGKLLREFKSIKDDRSL